MLYRFEQFVFTSFGDIGFKAVSSEGFPKELCHVAETDIVRRYWNSYAPPPQGFVGCYVHQVEEARMLFGWLYDEDGDSFGRNHVPYVLVYCVSMTLNRRVFEDVLTILERGPLEKCDRREALDHLPSVEVPSLFGYEPQGLGVEIESWRKRDSLARLAKGEMVRFFSPIQESIPKLSWLRASEIYVTEEAREAFECSSRYYAQFSDLARLLLKGESPV